MPKRELYVYWKTLKLDEAIAACLGMQAQLRLDLPGLEASTLVRDEGSTAQSHTLMEIYRHANGLDPAMEQHIHRHAQALLQDAMASPRKVEVFWQAAPNGAQQG